MTDITPDGDDVVAAAVAAATPLMDLPGVEGVGRGETPDGSPAVLLLCTGVTDELRGRLPDEVNGVPVALLDIGERPAAFDAELEAEEPHDTGEPDCC